MDGENNTNMDQDPRASKRVWTRLEEEALVSVLEEIVAQGGTCDNGTFRQGTTRQVEHLLAVTLPNSRLRAVPHIESKMRKLKKDYHTIFDMLNMSGFAWNDVKKCVEVDSDEAWQSYVQHHPHAKGWRGKPFPLYDRLAIIFGKDRATGKGGETPVDMGAMNDNEEHNQGNDVDLNDINEDLSPMSVNQSHTSGGTSQSQSSQKKRKRQSDPLASSLDNLGTRITSVLEKSANNVEKILEMMSTQRTTDIKYISDELKKMGYSVYDRSRLLRLFGDQPINVEIFKSLDYEDERVEFVMTLLSDM